MKWVLLIVSLAMMVCTPNEVEASTSTTASTIKAIVVYAGNSGVPAGLLIRTSQENPDNCPSSWWYSIAKTNPLYNEMVAVVMSAQAQGLKIAPSVTGCSGLHPNVTQIHMTVS